MYVLDYNINKSLIPLRDMLIVGVESYLYNSGVTLTKNKKDKILKATGCFVNNIPLYKDSFGITLDETHYSKSRVFNGQNTKRKVSYTYTKVLLDYLKISKYITLTVGGLSFNKGDWAFVKGKWTAIKFDCSVVTMNPSFIRVRDNYLTTYKEDPLLNVIELRCKKGFPLTFKLTPYHKSRVTFIQNFNKEALNVVVLNKGRVCDLQMKAIYNLNLELGGRCYMSGENNIQSISKEDRQYTTINGEATCCLDYSAFEPTILYTMEGLVMEGDPYVIELEGYDPKLLRDICKGFLLRMLNTESKSYAAAACIEMIRTEYNVDKLYSEGKIPDDTIPTRVIRDMLEVKHRKVAHRFYKKYGMTLQNVGTTINDYVVEYFLQRNTIAAQIHDAFIVQESKEDDLHRIMLRAFELTIGDSSNVKITKEH